MKEERLFYCTETERLLTLSDIEECRQISIIDGDSFATDTLERYLNACMLSNNGTLIEVKPLYTVSENGKSVCTVWNVKTDLD